MQKIKHPEKLSPERLQHSLGFKNSHEVALALQKALGTDRLRSSAGTWRGLDGDYNTYRRPQLEEEALLEGLDIWFAPYFCQNRVPTELDRFTDPIPPTSLPRRRRLLHLRSL